MILNVIISKYIMDSDDQLGEDSIDDYSFINANDYDSVVFPQYAQNEGLHREDFEKVSTCYKYQPKETVSQKYSPSSASVEKMRKKK
jgi:hypothetical protein